MKSILNSQKIIIISLSAILLVSILVLFSIRVLIPAYFSYIIDCQPSGIQQAAKNGYYVAGQTTSINKTLINISFVSQKPPLYVVQHECIHYSQLNTGSFSLSCTRPVGKYLSEVEAYSFQGLPNNIYNILFQKYGKECVNKIINGGS